MATKQDMAKELKKAIRASGLSQYRLARLSGVPAPTLSFFLSGKRRGITVDTVSKLAAALGLELRPAKRTAPRRRKGQE